MNLCQTAQLLMVDRLYDGIGRARQEQLDQHLARCADCQNTYRELADSVSLIKRQRGHDDLTADADTVTDLDRLWQRLQPELNRIDAQRYRSLRQTGRQSVVKAALALAACLALLISGMVLIRQAPITPTLPVTPTAVTTRGADANVNDFLIRVRPALLTLANATSDDIDLLPLDRELAQGMAREAGNLNSSDGATLSISQQSLLQDVEFLMWQYANMEDGDMVSGLEVLQLFLNDNYTLFKMKLNELQNADQVI